MPFKILLLSLFLFSTSCANAKNFFSPPAKQQKTLKVVTLTQNLQAAVLLLKCHQRQYWPDAKEKATRLIWNVAGKENRAAKAREFLENLKAAEESSNISRCQSLLKNIKYNIRIFEDSLSKKKGIHTANFSN